MTKRYMSAYTLKSLGKKWRNYKAHLKAKYFDESKTKTEMKERLSSLVNPDKFDYLVDYWLSEHGKVCVLLLSTFCVLLLSIYFFVSLKVSNTCPLADSLPKESRK